MSNFRLVMRNLPEFKAEMGKSQKQIIKAAERATKIEGFRLKEVLKEELKAGTPGGTTLPPLREITKYRFFNPKRNPLQSFSVATRYHVTKGEKGYSVSIGFIEGRISRTWIHRAKIQQEGFDAPVTQDLREKLAFFGAQLEKKGDWRAPLFFLRAEKTKWQTPARDMIDSFWNKHRDEAGRNIANYFEHKLRGEYLYDLYGQKVWN